MSFENKLYFLQHESWVNAWEKAAGQGHFAYFIEVSEADLSVSGWVLQYPYYGGKTFLLLAKGPHFSDIEAEKSGKLLGKFFEKIQKLAKEKHATFLKWEPSIELNTFFLTQNITNLNKWLGNYFFKNGAKHQIVFPASRIQFLATIVLPVQHLLHIPTDVSNIDELTIFYHQNKLFWKQRNSNVRRYTAKSLQQQWRVSTEKTQKQFEAFWQIHQQTSASQHFSTYSKQYYQTLFNQEISRIIILYDSYNQPQSVWFGVLINQSLIYLYGGNTEYAKTCFGQYLSHLVGVAMAAENKAETYDLGGWHAGEGYSKFKENYHGQIITWQAPVDVVFEPVVYKLISLFQRIRRTFRKR